MIFSEEIKKQTPKTCEYFEKIFTNDTSKLSPSIILYGDNPELSYNFATEIARILNCQNDGSSDCECLNCKWIRANKHPEVKTYSNLENKNDKAKTVISIDQIHDITEEINISSEYKRVYIFCGAKKLSDTKEDDNQFIHLPLTQDILQSVSANALLKSIEEPPANTYFIFITRDKEDMLPTIISRSQAFYVHSYYPSLPQISGLEDIFKFYPFHDYITAKEFTDNLKQWQKDNGLSTEETFEYAQDYLEQLLKSNISDTRITNSITSTIMKFEDAKKMTRSNFKDFVIYENLTYKIYKD